MQLERHIEDGRSYECNIPDADVHVMDGVKWGPVDGFFTPAFWRLRCIVSGAMEDLDRYRFGDTLEDELVGCLLGGHGISGELGWHAFKRLSDNGVMAGGHDAAEIEALLAQPLTINGKAIRYRYPSVRAKYIEGALRFLKEHAPPATENGSGVALRDWLLAIKGVGPKTASWVARNYLDAQDVAIIDIHIHRACVLAGVLEPNDNVTKDYLSMEARFVAFARGIEIPANVLDNEIWYILRMLPCLVRRNLMDMGVVETDRCGMPLCR